MGNGVAGMRVCVCVRMNVQGECMDALTAQARTPAQARAPEHSHVYTRSESSDTLECAREDILEEENTFSTSESSGTPPSGGTYLCAVRNQL